MSKLKLQVDRLEVQTFETAGLGAEGRGTVAAHMPKPPKDPPLIETYYVGDSCECTLAQSCIQTNCLIDCFVLTADTCPA